MKSRIDITTFKGTKRPYAKVARLINTETGEHVATARNKWLTASEVWEGWKSHKMHHDCAIVNRSRSRKLHATPEQALARFI
jgi:hypothetical protein